MKDYYKILGVTKSATEKEIKQAYRRKAKKLHPDNDPTTDRNPLFNELVQAYETISDPKLRANYDFRWNSYNQPKEKKKAPYQPKEKYKPASQTQKPNATEPKANGRLFRIVFITILILGSLVIYFKNKQPQTSNGFQYKSSDTTNSTNTKRPETGEINF